MEGTLSLDEELERRLDLVSRPEYEGEGLMRGNYVQLLLATVALPLVLLIIGWSL